MKKRTTIWLEGGHLKDLKTLSGKTGATIAALIRKAIEEYLKKNR
jgi:predicted DNA-binding protein